MKKLLSILSILVVASLFMAACGPTTTPTPQTIIQTAPPVVQTQVVVQTSAPEVQVITATSEPPKVTGTVRIGSWDSGDALKPINDAIISFQNKYPGVKVQLESVPQDYGTKLLAQVASGTAPDVFQVGGVQYLLTKDSSPLIIYYNKALFDAAGVDYPTDKWTWTEFLAAAQKLTNPAKKVWGIQLPDGWGDSSWTRGVAPIVYQNGGALVSPDGKTTTGFLNSDATVGALQWYFDLFKKYKVAPSDADVAALSGQDLFATGKVAMMWSGIWGVRGYMANPKLNFGMAQLPMGKVRGNSICWAGYGLYSKSQNKLAAWAFLKWIGAEGGAQEFAKYALTPVRTIAELQGLDKDPYYAPIMADLANVKPLELLSNVNYNTCVDGPFHDALKAYGLTGGDLKTIMTDVATKADACLAKPPAQ